MSIQKISLFFVFLFSIFTSALLAEIPEKDSCEITFGASMFLDKVQASGEASKIKTYFDGKGWNFVIEFPVKELTTRNLNCDARLREMLEETHFPVITVVGKDLPYPGKSGVVELPVLFKIKDKDVQGTATLEDWSYTDGVASFKLKGIGSLSAANLKAPAGIPILQDLKDEVSVSSSLVILNWPEFAVRK